MEFDDLEYDDLQLLAAMYSCYVMNFPEDHSVSYDEYPVSIYEYMENEWQEDIKEMQGE